MKASTARRVNMAVLTARAAQNFGATSSTPKNTAPVSRNLLARAATDLSAIRTGPVRRTTCAPMTGAMRSGHERIDGSHGRSLWTASPFMKDARMFDARQDQTISNRSV